MSGRVARGEAQTGNAIIDALPREVRGRIAAAGALRRLEADARLYEVGDRLTHTYFPIEGVVSQLTPLADGSVAESGTIGRESCVGPTSILMHPVARRRYEVRVPGEALVIAIEDLHAIIGSNFEARNIFMREAQASLNTALQLAVCNRLHSARERLSRWLLQADDRTGGGAFLLKQATLAHSLGVRRATVSEICSALAAEGGISYSRGRLRIRDRRILLASACECYAAIADPLAADFPSAGEELPLGSRTQRKEDAPENRNSGP